MERIVIEVDDQVAKYFNSAEAREQKRLKGIVSDFLNQLFRNKKSEDIDRILEEVGEKVGNKGLTVHKLGEIMGWDEETMKNLFGKDDTSNAG